MYEGRIKLVPLDIIHEEYIVKWRNDPNVTLFIFSNDPVSIESNRKWYETYKNSNTRKEFVIYISEIAKPIGTIGLSEIDQENFKAELTIILGESEYRGKGFGKEALKLILDYAFKALKLNKVTLKVFLYNERAIRLYKSVGFKQEGILRQDIYKNNCFNDVMEMSMLKEEWI